jgi:hypothetical protein
MSWHHDKEPEIVAVGRLQHELNEGRAVSREKARVVAPLAKARAEQARIQYAMTPKWRLLRRHRLLQEFMDETMAFEVLSAASVGRFV